MTRSNQHDVNRRYRPELTRFYEENPQAGPKGYLEPLAMISAAQIAEIIRQAGCLDRIAGNIWQMDLFTRGVSTGKLAGTDDCPRCGLNRPLESRTYSDLRKALAFLWPEADAAVEEADEICEAVATGQI
jgi:hypothetical protein